MRRSSISVLLLLLSGCGSPAAPSSYSLDGVWTGTIESSNFQAVSIAITFTHTNDSVDGTWMSPADWNGTMQGTMTRQGVFTGTMAFSVRRSLGKDDRCISTSIVSGAMEGERFRVECAGFSDACSGIPKNIRVTMERQR